MRRNSCLLLPLSFLFFACMDEEPTSPTAPAGAVLASADFVVNSLADPGDGTCDASECTLREAIGAASAGAVIAFDPKLSGSIQLGSELVVHASLTINGPLPPKSITLLGGSTWRVMQIQPGAMVEISRLSFADGWARASDDGLTPAADGGLINVASGAGGLSVSDATFRNGWARRYGGAVSARAPFSCTRCMFEQNEVATMGGYGGGAIYSSSRLHLDYTVVRHNRGGQRGGGVRSLNDVRINRSSFIGNTAGSGGGLYIDAQWNPERDVFNTTFSGNTASLGGAIHIANVARLWSVTVTGNTDENPSGSAVYMGSPSVRALLLFNSIVAANSGAADIGGTTTVETQWLQYSLIGNPGSVPLVNGANGNIVGVPAADVKLAPLASYGLTYAHRLQLGSPAINSGMLDAWQKPISVETLPVSDFGLYDQNDRPRPLGTRHDMGAVENLALLSVMIDITPGETPNRINLKKNGVLPVAVLGSALLDVSTVAPSSIRFGPADARPFHDLTEPSRLADHLEDVNGDGYIDLVLHFQTSATGLTSSSVLACLVAETASIQLRGCDAVVMK
jgi:CSLREA domain-containing protein